jgi:hypothetical protein
MVQKDKYKLSKHYYIGIYGKTTAAFILYCAGMCGKRGIGEFWKDQQELQLRCLLQPEKKWRCVNRPVDALGLTNESPLSCFPCVLCFSSFYLTAPCKMWTFYLLK